MDPREWIAALGPDLAVQAGLLGRLLTAVETDRTWEWLELGCSVAAGRGDALSDLDVGVGYLGDTPPPVHQVSRMVAGLGDVVDVADQPWDGRHRWWTLYADGGQLDLLVMPAGDRRGRAPGSVVLLDRTGRLRTTFTPRAWAAAPEEPRRWLLDGWEALSNVAKYVERGSLLEAVDQLGRARGRVLALWAIGEGVPYPAFGVTSLLDDPAATLPAGIEATYPRVDRSEVLAAAVQLGVLLRRAGQHATSGLDTPVRGFVTARLRRLVAVRRVD